MNLGYEFFGIRRCWLPAIAGTGADKEISQAQDGGALARNGVFELPEIMLEAGDTSRLLFCEPMDRIGKHPPTAYGWQLVGIADENETPDLSPVDRPYEAGHQTQIKH